MLIAWVKDMLNGLTWPVGAFIIPWSLIFLTFNGQSTFSCRDEQVSFSRFYISTSLRWMTMKSGTDIHDAQTNRVSHDYGKLWLFLSLNWRSNVDWPWRISQHDMVSWPLNDMSNGNLLTSCSSIGNVLTIIRSDFICVLEYMQK